MTDLLSDVDAPSDAELISRVRGGDVAAYGELFSRHKDAANRLAKQLIRGPDADDLVSEAFAKVLTVLQGGGGPDVAFRAYLLTAVRRLHVDKVRAGQRLQTTDDMTPFDPGVPFKDTAVAGFESGAAAKAFASLPERWQLVLWHLEVEGQKPADIAPLLGMSANSVSALAYRAREGLRQAFLTMHLSDISETDCRWVNEHLGAFVRKGLSKRDATKVQTHLDGCRRCTAMYLELADVNSNLAGIIAPLLLGAAAAGYLTSTGAGLGAGGVVSIMTRSKDFVLANTGAVAAGAVATGVAAAAVATVLVTQLGGGHTPDVVANPPASQSSALSSTPSTGPSSSTQPSTSTSPSAAAPTATLSASSTPSASTSPSAAVSPSVGLALLPSSLVPSGTPSGTASETPTESPSGGTSQSPGGGTTETPPPPPPAPALASLTVNGDGTGSVTVHVTNVGLGDSVDITMQSDETTFGDPPGECTKGGGDKDVTCFPGGAGGAEAAADVGDYTVTLPLNPPDSMVDDDLTISVSVNHDQVGDSEGFSFRPARTPTFDFTMPPVQLDPSAHTVGDTDGDKVDDVDRYDLGVTPQMPQRVKGLQFQLNGDARFRSVDGGACTVSGDGSKTLTCPDATDDTPLTLPVAADSLSTATDVSITVAPLVTFVDDASNNTSDPITLAPGAQLSLPDLQVFSARPDRSGLVQLQGSIAGLRPGMAGVTYDLQGAATFPDTGNPGCKPSDDGKSLVCDHASDGAGHADRSCRRPRRRVAGLHRRGTQRTLRARGLGGSDLTDAAESSHARLHVHRAAAGRRRPHPRREHRRLPPHRDGRRPSRRCRHPRLRHRGRHGLRRPERRALCPRRRRHGALHQPRHRPEPGPDADLGPDVHAHDHRDRAARRPVRRPGHQQQRLRRLRLARHQSHPRRRHGRAAADRQGRHLPSDACSSAACARACRRCFLDLGPGATYAQAPPSCTLVNDTTLRCDDPSDGTIPLSLKATDASHATALSVTATPGGDFQQLSDGNVASLTLRASYDFSVGDLTRTAQTITDDTDHYTLHTTIGDYPSGVGPLTYTVSGVQLAATQSDCTRVDATHATCGDGPVDLAVESTSTDRHDVTVAVQTPAGYDDPDPSNDASSISLQPGIDLKLADLDADNESPANDDRLHRVASRLDGTRKGLDSVTYTLTGNATFVGANVDGCVASGKTITCSKPSNGPITFTVRADDVHVATDIRIAVSAPDRFLELNSDDNSDGVRLLPRPTYDFAMGALSADAHTVTGSTDHFTLGSTVSAVPDGVAGLTFTVNGGTFASDQDTSCTRDDATHVTCTDLGSARRIGFRVDSTSDQRHAVAISLGVPSAYDDTNAGDDSASLTVSPGIDLSMSALTPSAPTPAANGTYTVSSTLTGVRSGAVRFTVSGATVTGTSCTLTSGTLVTCNAPTNGQKVSFTLRPAKAGAATPVTIHAQPADQFTELNPADNDASVTLAPDVALTSLSVRSDLLGVAVVRAQITGVPSGTSVVRLQLSGADAGTSASQVHLTAGASGADGEGPVDCYTSNASGQAQANGLYATCDNVNQDTDGSFFVDMRLAHPLGRTSHVTVTVIPVGVDQGGHSDNDSLGLTLH